ncbi:MAG: cobalamin-dependent protein, partial [Candidatus Bathyarchaeia archaeon]
MEDILSEISSTISNLGRFQKVQDLLRKALSRNIPVSDIVETGLREGLEQVGAKYEAGEYFLAELLFGASIIEGAMEVLRPELEKQAVEKKGTILLGTVRGDIHNIGKNIFRILAEATGFEVTDLDVDVDPKVFVEISRKTKPGTLSLSCLLTTGLSEIKEVIDMLGEAKMRSELKVLIGGNAVTKEFAKEVEADPAALSAIEGVNLCK